MFIRTVPEPRNQDELEMVRWETFSKEFTASQTIFSSTQIFPWHLYLIRGIPGEIPNPYIRQTRRIVSNFKAALHRLHDLYPKVQRNKNCSRETSELYLQEYPKHDPFGVTTRDLEVHYGHTGEQIGGMCEMREAWKFNDLKPRFYYAQGGRDYFASRYVKKLSIALMDSLGTTATHRRTNPEFFMAPEPHQYITFWDYTAFTTSLSELKFFLYWICRALEDLGTYNLWLVDYHLGKINVDPVELLDHYNETINIHSPFTIHRILDRFLYDFDKAEYYQENSGMLGVAGNIGFSTCCHGTVICTVCGEENCLCIGDDGEGETDDDPHDILIPTLQKLGTIEYSKFQILQPYEEGPAKFTKRGTFRDGGKLFIDFLYGLPISVFIDGIFDSRRTLHGDFTWRMRISKTVIAIGQLLWRIRDRYYETMPDEEYRYLINFLRLIYRSLKLPFSGSVHLPTLYLEDPKDLPPAFPLILPILSPGYDYRRSDWLEDVLAQRPTGLVIPDYIAFFKIPVPIIGDKEILPRTRDMKVLEDMGYITMKTRHIYVNEWNETNRRLVRQMLKRFTSSRRQDVFQSVDVEFIRTIPDKFLFMFDVPLQVDYRGMYTGEEW